MLNGCPSPTIKGHITKLIYKIHDTIKKLKFSFKRKRLKYFQESEGITGHFNYS